MGRSKSEMARTLARLGVRYGPMAYAAAKAGREPAQAAALKAWGGMTAKRKALHHAGVVVEGSALRVFHGDEPVWVVFSGDEPVATHPPVDTPVSQLLQHADLARRIRPEDAKKAAQARKAKRRQGPLELPNRRWDDAASAPQVQDSRPGEE